MFKPLALLLSKVVANGTLAVETHDGATHTFGDGIPPRIAIRLTDRRTEHQLALNPNLAESGNARQILSSIESELAKR